jgi:Domain of unknown function (DUF5753)
VPSYGTNLSAIEGGKRRLTAAKLTDLARVYELSPEEFLRFLGLEAGAASERSYQAELIPGLLQTADYARATFKGGSPYIRPVEVGPAGDSSIRVNWVGGPGEGNAACAGSS